MKTLLVPIDFSDATDHVLEVAADLTRQMAARLVLLHVTEPVPTYAPVGGSMDVLAAIPPPLEVENTPAQEERLAKIAAPFKAAGLDVQCVALLGLAVDDIVEHARSFHADYIVLGSHGHGALYHLFSGGVVTGVLKHATCPVVVVPIKHAHAKS